ncbi:hypothetical protein Plec18167_009072 [Paecilomyces lecythidis]|uniref:NAD(P)-binding domain-containing protein n=1 Tax=Paecilomyces lecythidis TaxID=3004212 RepID=A0ABR3WSW9_9EURO
MKVGIAGITGKFGHLLTTHLLEKDNVSIQGLCRDPSKLPEEIRSSPSVNLVKGDAFDDTAVRSFVQGCDVVVCCYLGDNKLMIDGQTVLIDNCDELHVSRYVASDWSLDYTKLELGQLFPKDPMIHVKSYLETKKNVSGVHVLIGAFMEVIFSPYFGLFDPKTNTFRYWGEGDEPMEGTTYDDAAKFTAEVIVDRNATGVLRFLGVRANIRELARTFEKVYGKSVTLERYGSRDELYKHMHDLRSKNPQDIFSYMPLFYYYYMINGQTLLGPNIDNARYPNIHPLDWEGFMAKWAAEELPASYNALRN